MPPKKKTAKRVTMQAIANRAKVHKMTVSLALRGHPSIPEKTRTRIRKLAEKMGYRPDPMLSALAAYSKKQGPGVHTGALAWVTNDGFPEQWKLMRHAVEFYMGAEREADSLGYSLETFSLLDYSPRRFRQVMRARNISGLVLAPQPEPNTEIEMDWDSFAVVTFGYTLAAPHFHRVNADHYGNMVRLLDLLVGRGYQRIGLVHGAIRDQRLQHMVSAAYFQRLRVAHNLDVLPEYSKLEIDSESFLKWYQQHSPDVIITSHLTLFQFLVEAGIDVPGKTGVVLLSVLPEDEPQAGMSENPRAIGAAAVRQLANMCSHGERGVPEHAHQLLIEGQWIEGKTLRY